MTDRGPARARLDELQQQLDDATGPYPVIHLANGPPADDEPEDYSTERKVRTRLRHAEQAVTRLQIRATVVELALLSTWIVLWQNW